MLANIFRSAEVKLLAEASSHELEPDVAEHLVTKANPHPW
jgi:hypothetical protein